MTYKAEMNTIYTELMASLPEELRQAVMDIVDRSTEEVKQARITGETGAGIVKVTVDSKNMITNIVLDCEFKEENRILIQDLIPAAHILAVKNMDDFYQTVQRKLMLEVQSAVRAIKDKQAILKTKDIDKDFLN